MAHIYMYSYMWKFMLYDELYHSIRYSYHPKANGKPSSKVDLLLFI